MPDEQSMRERLARIIDPRAWQQRDSRLRKAEEWDASDNPVTARSVRRVAASLVLPSLGRANAILDELLSPSEAMIEAGREANTICVPEDGGGLRYSPAPTPVWQAMISAARNP